MKDHKNSLRQAITKRKISRINLDVVEAENGERSIRRFYLLGRNNWEKASE